MSLLRQADIDYKGITKTVDEGGLFISITYKGSKEGIQTLFDSLSIGQKNSENTAYLTSKEMSQEIGPFWNCRTSWKRGTGVSISSGDTDPSHPTDHSLQAQMMSIPIEAHPEYKMRWKHDLIWRGMTKDDFEPFNPQNPQPLQWLGTYEGKTYNCPVLWITSDWNENILSGAEWQGKLQWTDDVYSEINSLNAEEASAARRERRRPKFWQLLKKMQMPRC